MALTGKLGTSESLLGNVSPGTLGSPPGAGDIVATAENNINLSQMLGGAFQLVSASSPMTISQILDANILPLETVTSTLVMGQTVAAGIPKTGTASSSFTLTQTALQTILNATASSPMTLTSTAYAAQPIVATASSPISLLDLARPGIIAAPASSPITLTQVADGDTNVQLRSATTTVALTQTAVGLNNTYNRSLTSVIALTQETEQGALFVSASNTIVLEQSTLFNPIERLTSSTLAMSQTVRVSPLYLDSENQLELVSSVDVRGPVPAETETIIRYLDPETLDYVGLDQRVSYHMAIANLDVISYISLADIAGRVLAGTATNAISLTSLVEQAVGYVAQDLSLSQTAVATTGKPGDNDVSLEQAVSFVIERALAPVNTVTLEQIINHVIGEIDLCQYDSFGLPPAPTLATGTLTLTYPFASPTTTLVLRNPNFNNSERLDMTRINRETRGKTLIIYADTIWPKLKILTMEVSWLKAEQAADLLDFLQDSLGQEIGLLDHEGRQWKGIILNPQTPVLHSARHNREAELEFEGELV